MKSGNWVPLSKALVKALPKDRAFTELEAMFSLQVNYDCNKPCTVRGLATRWQWSRNKVLHFMSKHGVFVEFEGSSNQFRQGKISVKKRASNDTSSDTSKGPAIVPAMLPAVLSVRFIDYKHLSDTAEQPEGQQLNQQEGQQRATEKASEGNLLKILDPIKEKKISPECSGEDCRIENFYTTKRRRQLKGEKLAGFMLFWNAFGYKEGKAAAADAWLDLKNYSEKLLERILVSAKREAAGRAGKRQAGKVPIMAEGWLSGRRWEDEVEIGDRGASSRSGQEGFDYSALQVGKNVLFNGIVHKIEEGFLIRPQGGTMGEGMIKNFYRQGKITVAQTANCGA